MLIIFGMRSRVKNLGTLLLVCRRCNTPAANRVMRVERWFTLFFIPIIPVSKKYRLTCTFCGGVTSISKEDALQFEAAAQQGQTLGQGVPASPDGLSYPNQQLPGYEPVPPPPPMSPVPPTSAMPPVPTVPPPPPSSDGNTGDTWPQPAPVPSRPANWPQIGVKPTRTSARPYTFPARPPQPPSPPPTVSDEP
jgi:zinc-ribbon family